MTSVAVKDLKGKSVGEVTVSDKVFGIEPNTHVVHLALQRQLANARAGTACTKTRAEVRGGGRKPWRQKGTGRARAGSIRSPLWEGGGVIFGPKPRDYSQSMNRKTRRLALRSMLSARLADTIVVQNFDELLGGSSDDPARLPAPKTKNMCKVLEQFGLCEKTVLLVLNKTCPRAALVERAARNIEGLKVIDFTNLNVKDLAYHDVIIMTEGTLKAIDARFSCADEAAATCTAEGKSKPAGNETTAEPKAPAKAKKAPAEKPAEEKAKAPRAKKKSSEE